MNKREISNEKVTKTSRKKNQTKNNEIMKSLLVRIWYVTYVVIQTAPANNKEVAEKALESCPLQQPSVRLELVMQACFPEAHHDVDKTFRKFWIIKIMNLCLDF